MLDIKIKPQMDQPKVRVVNNTPKDAGTILKKEYAERQKEKQPDTKGSVQYATDRVETTGRRGTVAAADGMRRMAKKARDKKKATTSSRQKEQLTPPDDLQDIPSGTAPRPLLEEQMQPRLVQARQEQAAQSNRPISGMKNHPYNKIGTHFSDITEFSPYRAGQADTPKPNVAASPKERGRHKAIEDAKTTRQKARNLAEKENIIAPRTSGTKAEGRQVARHHSAAVKRGSAAPKHNAPVPLKQTATQRAKQMVQSKAQRKMLTQTATKAKQGIKTSVQALAQGVMAIGRAAAAAVSSILAAGGGLALFLVLLVVIVIGAIAASPFGILFSEENTTPDTLPVSAAVAQVHDDLNTQLAAIQTADSYDDITLVGATPDWADILAVFAVKVAGTDSPDAADVVTIDADRIARLKNVFWDMCSITPHVETTHHPDSDPDDEVDDSWTEKDLTITIAAKTASDMVSAYGFTTHQISALDELLLQRDVLLELAGNLTAISAATSKVLKELPEDLSEDREAVVRVACSLVGKVNYFWGGKSHAIGWDSRWGQIYEVTAADSPTSGTYRPYGMDCSGYIDWVFNNALGYIIGHGGGAMMQHTYCTNITWDEAQIGDLAFYPDDEHVGIVAGWDEAGNILIVHCASGYNNVVITGAEGFTSVARPHIFTYSLHSLLHNLHCVL